MIRQKYFYHASPECDLKFIEPRKKTLPRNFSEGEVIFATDNLTFAAMFLVSHDDSWANGGAFNDVPYFVISDRERYLRSDKGGCIYLVLSKEFIEYNKREWFSKNKLDVKGSIRLSSGLMAMIMMGVQVYFTDRITYQKIRKASDHGLKILNSLTSENEKLCYKVQELEMYFGSKKLTL